nr:MAG TPA: minor tail protein [Caudoviricetes sp.]
MPQDVGILTLKAIYDPSNIGEITSQIKSNIEQIEKNAGTIETKLKAPNAKEFKSQIVKYSKEIQKYKNGKLKGFNLSNIMNDSFEAFANPKAKVKDYSEGLHKTAKKLKTLATSFTSDELNLMKDFRATELNSVLNQRESIDAKKNDQKAHEAGYRKEANEIRASSTNTLKSAYKNNEKYKADTSNDAINQLSASLGLDKKKEAANAVKEYSELLSLFDLLSEKRNTLLNPSSISEAREAVQTDKDLQSIIKKIGDSENELSKVYGATNLKSPKLDGFGANSIEGTITKFVNLKAQKSTDAIAAAELKMQQYIIDTAKKRTAQYTQAQNDAISKAEEKIDKKRGANNTFGTNTGSSQTDVASDIQSTGEAAEKATSQVENFSDSMNNMKESNSSSTGDIWKDSFSKIKSEYADLEKYAVDGETALSKLEELKEKYYAKGLNKEQQKDLMGFFSRADSLDKEVPSETMDVVDMYYDDYESLVSRVEKMTSAQKIEMSKLKKKTSSTDTSTNTDNSNASDSSIQTEAKSVEELQTNIEQLNASIAEMKEQLGSLNGNAFDQMSEKIAKMTEDLQKLMSLLNQKDLDKISSDSTENNLINKLKDKKSWDSNAAAAQIDDKSDGYNSMVDSIVGYYNTFKNTDAYLKKQGQNIEERAILLKNGNRIGSEYVDSNGRGSVNIKDGITKYNPDAVLHTHPYDNELDNLRFSMPDIKNLVDGTIQKAMLICGDELMTMDMSNIDQNQFNSLQNDIQDVYNAVFARYGAQLENGKLTGISELPANIQNQATNTLNYLLKDVLQSYGGDLLFDQFDNSHGGSLYENDVLRLPIIDDTELAILNKFKAAVTSLDPEKNLKKLQTEYTPHAETPKAKEVKSKSSYEYKEDSSGQMAMFDGVEEAAAKAKTAQNELQNEIKQTNEVIDGQISMFDKLDSTSQKSDLDNQSRAQEELADGIKKTSEAISNTSSIEGIESELSSIENLSAAVDAVTEAVGKKTEAFQNEGSAVTSAVESEINSLKDLASAVNDVTDAKNKAKSQDSTDTSKKKDNSNPNDQKKHVSSSKSDNSISDIPSTYVRNIDKAFDEATKINDALKRAEVTQKRLKSASTENTQSVTSKAVSDIDTLNKKLTSGQVTVKQFDSSIQRIQDNASKVSAALNNGNLLKNDLLSSSLGNMEPIANKITSTFDNLNNKLSSGEISVKQYESALNNMSTSLKSVHDYANNADEAIVKMQKHAKEASNGRAVLTTTKDLDKAGNEIAKVTAVWEDNKITQTYTGATNAIQKTVSTTEQATGSIGKFFSKLQNKWSDVAQYLMSYVGMFQMFDVVKDGLGIIRDLDDALTEMSKVSDEPLANLKDFQKESFGMADEIGTTGIQIQKSTADFLRLGETFDEAKESAEAANVLFNVSEFSSIDEATESLIAMSSAYKDLDKMDIDDKLNNIGNNYSISTDGLATALQTSASALTTAGNDIDKSIALITAGNAVVQDPSSVGAGTRTIALRLTGTEEAKKTLEETGEDTSDFIVQTASKINDSFKAFTAVASNDFKGISLLDDNGNNRDTYEVLKDVADIYDEIIQTDKKYGTNHMNGLLELMAGKNRANIAASIIQNGDMLKNVYKDSQHSEGSALEENQKQLDSISGHLDQLKNKWQEVWSNTASRDQINWFLDAGKSALNIVDKIGLIPTAIGIGSGIKSISNAATGKQGILSTLFGWPKSKAQLMIINRPLITENYT